MISVTMAYKPISFIAPLTDGFDAIIIGTRPNTMKNIAAHNGNHINLISQTAAKRRFLEPRLALSLKSSATISFPAAFFIL